MTICPGQWCGGDGAEEAVQGASDLVGYLGDTASLFGPICQDGLRQAIESARILGYSQGLNAGKTSRDSNPVLTEMARYMRAMASGIPRQLTAAFGPQGVTPAAVVGLSLPLAANRTYRIETKLIYRTSGVDAGMQCSLVFAGGTASDVQISINNNGTLLAGTALGVFLGGNGVGPGPVDVEYRITATMTPSAGGILAFRVQATGLLLPTCTVQAGSSAVAFDVTQY